MTQPEHCNNRQCMSRGYRQLRWVAILLTIAAATAALIVSIQPAAACIRAALAASATAVLSLGRHMATAEWVGDTLIPLLGAIAGLVVAVVLVNRQIKEGRQIVLEGRRQDFAKTVAIELRELGQDIKALVDGIDATKPNWPDQLRTLMTITMLRSVIPIRSVEDWIGGPASASAISDHIYGTLERWDVWCKYIQESRPVTAPMQPYVMTLSCEATGEALKLETIAMRLEIWSGADGSAPAFSKIKLSERRPAKLLTENGHTKDEVAQSEAAVATWKQEQVEHFKRQSKDFSFFGYSIGP